MTLPFPVYEVGAESAFERGFQHGSKARDQVAATIDTYRQIFRDFVRIDWDEAKRIGKSYEGPIERYDAEIAEEIRGVAEGSGFEHAEVLALNSRSEIALSANHTVQIVNIVRLTPSGGTRGPWRLGVRHTGALWRIASSVADP